MVSSSNYYHRHLSSAQDVAGPHTTHATTFAAERLEGDRVWVVPIEDPDGDVQIFELKNA